MWKLFGIAALVMLVAGVDDAQAGWWRNRRYTYYQNTAPAMTAPAAVAAAPARVAPAATAQAQVRRYSYSPGYSSPGYTPWPYYPNVGNPEGTAYSPAAALRPGQVYGTFGLRPADARARGNY